MCLLIKKTCEVLKTSRVWCPLTCRAVERNATHHVGSTAQFIVAVPHAGHFAGGAIHAGTALIRVSCTSPVTVAVPTRG